MKIKTTTSSVILLSAAAIALTGCQQTRLIFQTTTLQSRAVPSPVASQSSRRAGIPGPVRLAVDHDVPADPPASAPALNETEQVFADAPEVAAVAYTAPPAWVRNLVLAVASVVASVEDGLGSEAGKDVSESLVHSAAGVTGRAGLTSPGTTVDGAVVGRIGTSAGGLAGIGGGSSNNIHSLQRNPATGPGGRCGELTSAGLATDHAACSGGARRR